LFKNPNARSVCTAVLKLRLKVKKIPEKLLFFSPNVAGILMYSIFNVLVVAAVHIPLPYTSASLVPPLEPLLKSSSEWLHGRLQLVRVQNSDTLSSLHSVGVRTN
jgi:hypothetical protein